MTPLNDRPIEGGHLKPVVVANVPGEPPLEVDIQEGTLVQSISPGPNDVVVIPVMAVAGVYAANDALGALVWLQGVARTPGRGVEIYNAMMQSKAEQTFTATLFVFTANPTGSTFTDNSPMDVVDNDIFKLRAKFSFTTFRDVGGGYISLSSDPPQIVEPNDDSRDLWAAIIVDSGTPTFANGDIQVSLGLVKN